MALECTSEECLTARSNLEDARNEIISLCARIKSLTDQRNNAVTMAVLYGAMAAAMLALAVVLVAIPIIGLFFAGLLVLAVTFLGIQASYLASVASLSNQLRQAQSELASAMNSFQAAVSEVIKNCPSECWGNLVMPTC